jgi:serine protease Do
MIKSVDLGLKLGIFFSSAITRIDISAIACLFAIFNWCFNQSVTAQEVPTVNISPEKSSNEILQLCQPATVRIVKATSAGSGVIVGRQGNLYSVLTSWHVVNSSNPLILTKDDQQHQLTNSPQHLGNADLAVLQFYSEVDYPQAEIETQMPQIGDKVYAAGFPLSIGSKENTVDLGNKAFRWTQGEISIIPLKSLPQGYRLGYTNDTEMGMSGSPIFNSQGLLIGIHGRGKYRDPGFGVYLFEDGSEPSPQQLQQMIRSSWAIPIGVYSKLLNSDHY